VRWDQASTRGKDGVSRSEPVLTDVGARWCYVAFCSVTRLRGSRTHPLACKELERGAMGIVGGWRITDERPWTGSAAPLVLQFAAAGLARHRPDHCCLLRSIRCGWPYCPERGKCPWRYENIGPIERQPRRSGKRGSSMTYFKELTMTGISAC
jgi:hypothetical protein